jgi:hypothetical protein
LKKTSRKKRTFKIFDGKNQSHLQRKLGSRLREFKFQALHKMTGETEQCHGKRGKDFIENRKGQTEVFDSDSNLTA